MVDFCNGFVDETICIRVKGDSMSPKIEDGDLIQVHKQSSVDSGDIAVVLLDGSEGLVKKVVYDAEYIQLIKLAVSIGVSFIDTLKPESQAEETPNAVANLYNLSPLGEYFPETYKLIEPLSIPVARTKSISITLHNFF